MTHLVRDAVVQYLTSQEGEKTTVEKTTKPVEPEKGTISGAEATPLLPVGTSSTRMRRAWNVTCS